MTQCGKVDGVNTHALMTRLTIGEEDREGNMGLACAEKQMDRQRGRWCFYLGKSDLQDRQTHQQKFQ